jgi:hypothetical protein
MKLDLCLLACDLNPMYYDFFPLIKTFWKKKVKIDCILILVANDVPYSLRDEADSIILFPPLKNIPTAFQAQCIRLLYPCLLSEFHGIIISDMDIIPLQSDFFVKTIENLDQNNTFCIYRDVISEYNQYPMCYCAASSETWRNLFNVHIINDIVLLLEKWYSKDDYAISSASSEMWAQDQLQLFQYVKKNSSLEIKKFTDEQTKFTRLDRADVDFISKNKNEIKKEIENKKYSDFHLPRPYQNYKELLDAILQ